MGEDPQKDKKTGLTVLRGERPLGLQQLDGNLRDGVRLGQRKGSGLHEHLYLGEVRGLGREVHLADGGFRGLHIHLGDKY